MTRGKKTKIRQLSGSWKGLKSKSGTCMVIYSKSGTYSISRSWVRLRADWALVSESGNISRQNSDSWRGDDNNERG